MPRYGMVIDLQRCVGCGSCAIACKTENNTQQRGRGQTFNWADFIQKTEGKFPDVRYTVMPVLCNHCTDAACVKVCPKPKALYKTEDGITMYNYKMYVQCRKCQDACPYSARNVEDEKADYSVISFNEIDAETHESYLDKNELIKGCTASGSEAADKAGAIPPHRNAYRYPGYKDVRKDGMIEKCTFCIHMVKKGEEPYCVVSCPANARTFGDLDDKNSEISQTLKKHKPSRLKNNKGDLLKDGEKGTQPNVSYIRSFKPGVRKT